MPLKKDEELIAVNITALLGLTKVFGADMAKAGKGRIMNVTLLLSFLPFPYYAISANKPMVAKDLANAGIELFLNGEGKKMVGLMNWFLINLSRVSLHRLIMKIKMQLASSKK